MIDRFAIAGVRARTAALGTCLLLVATAPAAAFRAPAGGATASTGMEPGLEAAEGAPARRFPDVVWDRAPAVASPAWTRFKTAHGGSWRVLWDRDTAVPSRILGSGIAAPGSLSSPSLAAGYARALLAEHIDLLAPGAAADDFVLVTNHVADGMRTIGMVQTYRGLPVVGGQVSFRFKNDRLFVIGSEALPHVNVGVRTDPTIAPAIAPIDAFADAAAAFLHERGAAGRAIERDAITVDTADVAGPLVLPIIHRGAVTYHLVARVTASSKAPIGRWDVYLDVETAAPVAREQRLRFASGQVAYNVPARYPGSSRSNRAAPFASIGLAAGEATTDIDGGVSWPEATPVSAVARTRGSFVFVHDDDGDDIDAEITLSPGQTAVLDLRDDERQDAQTTTFVHAFVVKEYVRVFAPTLAFLDMTLDATVNIDDACNAFSDGTTINFFRSSANCENTGRLPDVVYHEFGHSMHAQSLLEGVGVFDGGFGEGLSDYLAATMTNDSGMGRGFFFDDEPLRELDPLDMENRWPDDIGEVHFTGLIFAGAMWDLRTRLIQIHGQAAGVALADRLFYAAVQRSSGIPASYAEILAADDDDGDLTNGTPNECAINEAFGAHGLRGLRADISQIAAQPPEVDGYDVSMVVTGTSEACVGDEIESVTLGWRMRGEDAFQPLTMTDTDGVFATRIPQAPQDSVVEYQASVRLADGTDWVFPDNLARPFYEFYVGELVTLYCTDFETDPFADGWTHGLIAGDAADDDWTWGAPLGNGGDPPVALSGANVLGTDLGGATDGSYENEMISFASTPTIDVDRYSDVRLQYWRWLTVEDAIYDKAVIYADGEEAWVNTATLDGVIHHLDNQWAFHDVPLSPHMRDFDVRVRFEIQSDQGLEFGGWNIDDLCIVAAAGSICGDGALTGAEQCDDGDGNDDAAPNACRTNCRLAGCGDSVLDDGEQCDDGNTLEGDGCTAQCLLPEEDGGGCCQASADDTPAPIALVLLGFAWMWRRRRPRAAS